MINFTEKTNFIWSVADLLRGNFKQSEYGKVILPFTVLRRFDCVLAPSKEKILEMNNTLTVSNKAPIFKRVTGHDYYNLSRYDFEKLIDDASGIETNLRDYINGFSDDVKEILDHFEMGGVIERLKKANLLYLIVQKFAELDLAMESVDNLEMGYMYEELIRRFSELSNETAGEHFTPREVIELMVDLLFEPDMDEIIKEGKVVTVFDPACGTGGMLSVAQNKMRDINNRITVIPFGQELNPETYATCKSDMILKGNTNSIIQLGNSFNKDGFRGEHYDYLLSNPPFGVSWKKVEKFVKDEAQREGFNGRFGAGTPRISDGSLLFLQHMISKMNDPKKGGSRIAIVFNGSPMFTGDAGSGESEIRRWIIENDMLEAIVALPDQLFYNTGISTYIWIVTNRKTDRRKGKVRLVNGTQYFEKMRKSLGSKRNYLTDKNREDIVKLYSMYEAHEDYKDFDNEDFGFYKVTIERPELDENGNIVIDKNGNKKADTSLRDTENIPLKDDMDEYFKREVLPYVSDAWIDESKTKIGYEIPLSRYFFSITKVDVFNHINETINEVKMIIEDYLNKISFDSELIFRGVDNTSFKDSLIEWVGEIPTHWEVKKAKYIFRLRNTKGNEYGVLLAATQKQGMIPQDQVEGVVQVKEDTDLQKFKTVHQNDFVISLRSFQGGFEMSDYEGVCSPAYQVFYNIEDINPKYFKLLFKSSRFIQKINSLTVGIRDGKNILFKDFSEMYIPLPPIEEQIKIVNYLDDRMEELRKGMFDQLNLDNAALKNMMMGKVVV